MSVTDLNSRSTALDAPDGSALVKTKGSFYTATLTGNITLDATYPKTVKLDPGGSARDVTLDAIATNEGLQRKIVNAADAAENLVVKNAAGSTIVTINQNEEADVYCDGAAWYLICVRTIALS